MMDQWRVHRCDVPEPDQRTRLQALRDLVLGPDSYGIVFLFLLADYVFLTVGWSGAVALIVSAIWLGLTVLLAFAFPRSRTA